MHPVVALERLGGVADSSALLRLTSRRRLRTCLETGEIVRASRNRYTLPTAHVGLQAAARLSGVASHDTAAAVHGWKLARRPTSPSVIVPRKRKVAPARRAGVTVRWRDLPADDARGAVTEPHRTVVDCARDLPFVDALAVADSALRSRAVDRSRLLAMAEALGSTGRRRALRVVRAADPRAANPFEFHGSRKALTRDCERYNALVLRGWTVVRFSWEQVMLRPDYVRDVLVALVEGPHGPAVRAPSLLWVA